MSAIREAKQEKIDTMKARFEQSELVILYHNKGMTVKQDSALRAKLREAGATTKVTKNTLARLAIAGTKFEGLADKMKGPTGIATSADPIAAARIVYDFAKTTDKLQIIGGASATEMLDLGKIQFLATLPSMDQLRGKLVGLLQAPGAQLARLANAYATKDSAEAPAA